MQPAQEFQPRSNAVVAFTRDAFPHQVARSRAAASRPLLRPGTVRPVATLEFAPARARRDFERAVLPCQPALRASALRLTKSRADADDLVQETLLRAWRFWPSYREQDQCRAWLQRIMSNTFCSGRRSAARRRVQLEELAAMQAQSEASTDATQLSATNTGSEHADFASDAHLAASLAALKPEQRRILCLIDVHERSYREAALELACPIGTVMSRLHRARRALRVQLAAAPRRA